MFQGFIPPFFTELMSIVVLFPERSHLELQAPECPGIPWRLWMWKEHFSPWRAPGNKCPPSLGWRLPGAGMVLSAVSITIHPDLWPISVLCCAFAPAALLSSKPQLPTPFKPNNFSKSTLWSISDPAQTSLDLFQLHQSQALLSLVLQLFLPTLSCTERKFPFFWVAELITGFLELKYTII